jgi:hypothetical protein
MPDQRTRPSPVAVGAALIGAVLLVVSAFLVWGSLHVQAPLSPSFSEKGTDSAAGLAVIALGVGVLALLIGWFAGLPPRFVRAGWGLFGVGAIGLSVYALIQINSAPGDFFNNLGVSDFLSNVGLDQGDVTDIAKSISSVDYGAGVFVAMAGGVATLIAALMARPRDISAR